MAAGASALLAAHLVGDDGHVLGFDLAQRNGGIVEATPTTGSASREHAQPATLRYRAVPIHQETVTAGSG